jgi:hypothetical protein
MRRVMGLGTAQRNISTAIVVATRTLPKGIRYLSSWWLQSLLLLVLLPTAKRRMRVLKHGICIR